MLTPAEVQQALAVARALATAGVPIFVAWPDASKETGFALPTAWQQTRADPAVVDRWRPGMALCAVTGQGLDLIDVDPRNGGDLAALNGTMPTSYGVASTPSGGVHSFVRSLGVRSRDNVLPGVDVKAGDAAGEGRGFAFIAPTVRKSKVDGQMRPYRWASPLDVARAVAAANDTSGTALAELVRQVRATGTSPNGAASGGWSDPQLAELVAHGIPEGQPHDATLKDVAWKLRGQRIAKDVALGLWQAIVDKTATDPARPFTEADFARHWKGADTKIGKDERALGGLTLPATPGTVVTPPAAEDGPAQAPAPHTDPGSFFVQGVGLHATALAAAVLGLGPLAEGVDDRMWSYARGVWSPDPKAVRKRCARAAERAAPPGIPRRLRTSSATTCRPSPASRSSSSSTTETACSTGAPASCAGIRPRSPRRCSCRSTTTRPRSARRSSGSCPRSCRPTWCPSSGS